MVAAGVAGDVLVDVVVRPVCGVAEERGAPVLHPADHLVAGEPEGAAVCSVAADDPHALLCTVEMSCGG